MKNKKKLIVSAISVLAIGAIAAGIGIGNTIAFGNEKQISNFLCPPIIDDSVLNVAAEEGQKLSKQLVQDGSVLLQNKKDCLPLDKDVDTTINVFGHASIDWAYGASGQSCSGMIVAEDGTAKSLIDLTKALNDYGIDTNKDLSNMYKSYKAPLNYALSSSPSQTDRNTLTTLVEPAIDNTEFYTDELLEDAEDFSDIAVFVLQRNAAEDRDLDFTQNKSGKGSKNDATRQYLDLSTEEIGVLEYLGDTYDRVIVIVNTPNALNLTPLTEIPGIDAILDVGHTGTQGASAIPQLLYGEISPSGKTVDTFDYTHDTNPAYVYKNPQSYKSGSLKYNDYVEGIYVGYKWYETADKEGLWNDYSREVLDKNDTIKEVTGYDAVVQYPFGFGLSYTSFDWSIDNYTITTDGLPESGTNITNKSKINLEVAVTNTGKVSGKDVVQIYVTTPYTKGGIEKSYVSLVGFGKTHEIEPGRTEVVKIEIDANDFASYDCYDANSNNFKGYELEKGTYELKIMTDSHNLKDGIDPIKLNVADTIKIDKDAVTGHEVKNLFTGEDALDGMSVDGIADDKGPEYISRSNFPDMSTFKKADARTQPAKATETAAFTKADATEWDNATTDIFGNEVDTSAVVWGSKETNHKIYEAGEVTDIGWQLAKDYNDPLWDEVMDQVTFDEAKNTISKSYGTPAISSIGKPELKELDGPAQIKSYYQSGTKGTGYPDEVVIACTWNQPLVENFGLSYAKDMSALGINGLWGWGINIHRTAEAGRNFEYFSEDSFLAGTMCARAVRGLNNGGRHCYLKHLVLNDCETSKVQACTYTTEQALREIYLKPFQMTIQKADCLGVMTSFNRIGASYTGGSETLLKGVLRDEWGFNGSIITDWAPGSGSYMCIDDQLRASGDLGMNTTLGDSGLGLTYTQSSCSNRLQARMKECVKHVTYTYLRSQYNNKVYNENPNNEQVISRSYTPSYNWWIPALKSVDALAGCGLGIWLYFIAIGLIPLFKKED